MPVLSLCCLLLLQSHDAFRAQTLPEALVAAGTENKPLLLYVHTRWQQLPIVILDDPRVKTTLADRFVALRCDLADQPDVAARYDVSRLPLFLLLNADGRETDRIIPFGSPGDIERELQAAAEGINAEDRARTLLERMGSENPFARERLADALTRRERYAEALTEYAWLLDVALKNVMFAAARRDLVAADMARLSSHYPPALDELRKRRTAWADALLAGADDANVARNVASADRALSADADTLALFDKLPAESRARQVLFDRVIDQLIDGGRYNDALRSINPLEHYQLQLQLAGRGGGLACCSLHSARGPGAATPLIERGARLVEATAAKKMDDVARKLIVQTLAVEDTPNSRAILKQRLERVARQDLVSSFPATVSSQPAKPSTEGATP